MKSTLVIFALMIATASSVFAECSEADKKALETLDKAWSDAIAKGDRTALAAIYAEEYVGFPSQTKKVKAIDDTMAAFERNKANPPTAVTTPDHYMISCTPVSATIVHRNVTVSASGNTSYSRSVHFLEKRGGKWRVVSNAGNTMGDADIITYMEWDWINAMKTRNMDWFEKNFASDFTEVSFMTGDVANKRQWIDHLKNDTTAFDALEVSDMNVRVDGNTAIVTGLGWGKGKMGDGSPFDFKIRFTDTFIKRDGRWQPWASHATIIPAK